MKMIYRKLTALLLTALVMTLTACEIAWPSIDKTSPSTETTKPGYYTDIPYIQHADFRETPHYDDIASAPITATHIFFAEYTGEYELDGPDVYLYFKPIQQFKGDPIDEDILVTKSKTTHIGVDERFTPYTYTAAPHKLRKDTTYWIFLERTLDVYSKYPDHYLLFNQFADWWPSEYENVLDDPSYQEKAQKMIDYLAKHPSSPQTKGKDFIRSNKLEDIIVQSPTILRIRVDKREADSSRPCFEHKCHVVEVLKGDVTAETDIFIFLRYSDTYTSGHYIVILDETARFITSPYSMISYGDRDKVEQIYDILGLPSPYPEW